MLVNPPEEIASGDGISIVYADIAPVALGSMNAAAVAATADEALIKSLVAALRAGSRMLGPLSLEIPQPLNELVRDDAIWGATLSAAVTTSAPVQLRRG